MRFIRDTFEELKRGFGTPAEECGKRKFHHLIVRKRCALGVTNSSTSSLGTNVSKDPAQALHVIKHFAQVFPGATQWRNFREKFVQLNVQKSTQTKRWLARLQEPLLEFFEQTLDRKVFERKRLAKFNRLGRKSKRKTARKLHASQNAQRIFDKGWAHMAQQAFLQVVNAAVWVTQRKFRKFHAHRIDGKVTTECRFLEREFLIRMHHETAVAIADFAFGTREREIEREALHRQMDHAKSLPDKIRTAVLL